jgi:predicted DCC family thiol-disulfide oxidoreductase YuxK
MQPTDYPLTIYYDASCPLCATEMHALKRNDAAGVLELVDCSAPEFDVVRVAIALATRAAARRAHANAAGCAGGACQAR